jgi:hypothetical protein
MTTLVTGLNSTNRGVFASINRQIYFANDFDAVQVWNGIGATTQNAGYTGPAAAPTAPAAAAGNVTNGVHRFRYRYKDSKTGYVSNPSPELSVTVSAGNGALTFTAGAQYVVSADAKVDTVVFEMTAVNGKTWYVAKEVLNSAASAVVSITDLALVQQFNVDANWGAVDTGDLYSHESPPVKGGIIVQHKSRAFIGGDIAYSIATAGFTNGSPTVTGTGFSTNWVGRLLQAGTDTTAYEILTATTTTLTLVTNYGGTTNAARSFVIYSKTPNRIYYSRLGDPSAFYTAVWARDMLVEKSDRITAMFSRRDALYIFGQYCAERLVFDADPSATTSATIPIQGQRGAFNQRVLVEFDGNLLAWDRRGIYRVGEVPEHLSAPVDNALTELIDYSATVKFHAGWDPVDRIACFFFVATGDTQPKYAACLEVDTGKWFFDSFMQGITASSIVPTSDGQVRLLLGDENGYSWFFSVDGSFDGVPPGTSSVLTATGTPTTTVIDVTQILSTSPSLAGVPLYNPSNGDIRIIASNTASQITVAALSVAPVSGDTLYIGAISWEWRSKWWMGPGLDTKKRPTHVFIQLFPGTATGKLRVSFYTDFSTSPTTYTQTVTSRDGVTITSGLSYASVDLDAGAGEGFVGVPVPSSWARVIQVRVQSDRPDGELRILDISFGRRDSTGVVQQVLNE